MKNLFILFLFIQTIVVAQQSGMEWYKLQSPTDNRLRHITFVDSLTGWAAGESGTIIRTTDGGNSWVEQNSGVQTNITDIYAVDRNLGWALTYTESSPFRTIILNTTDGGANWIAEDFPDSNIFMGTIFFFDSLNGFVGGHYIAYTTDGGNSWIEADIPLSVFSIGYISFFNRQFGYACGGAHDIGGAIYKTTDYGLTWTNVADILEISNIFIFDSLNAISLSCDLAGSISKHKTTNAGVSWTFEWLNVNVFGFSIDFRTSNEGWSASYNKFLFTSDKGETWIEKDPPNNSLIYDLQFLNSQTGFACGEEGVILKYGIPPVKVEDEINSINGFALYQNYPNPFNPTTRIQYQVSELSQVSLKVYDVLGNEVATLLNEEKPAGSYEIEFNATKFASGAYFYKLQAGGNIEVRKMLLLK